VWVCLRVAFSAGLLASSPLSSHQMAARVALLLVIAATSLSSSAARRRGVSAAATAMASPSVRASAQTPPPEPAYEAAGPCTAGPTVVRGSLRTTNTGERLSMTLTLPGGASDDGRRAPPWPVVAFFNGFQVRRRAGSVRFPLQSRSRFRWLCRYSRIRVYAQPLAEVTGHTPEQ